MITTAEAAGRIRAIAAEYSPGDRLPPQYVLVDEIGASVGVTRRAMARLVEDGTLTRQASLHFVAQSAIRPQAAGSVEQIEQRAELLWRLRRHYQVTVERLARMPVSDRVLLAATGDPETAARRVRIAVETLHSVHADDIRSALGLDPRTIDEPNIETRRKRLSELSGQPATGERERHGARELAGHIESLLDLAGRGLLDLNWGSSKIV